ncbi:hypothetical protein M9H77_00068 [Catharanthus roseus]|nr:hypothetical protein M9H77_00068 [Catharanthus roseus]
MGLGIFHAKRTDTPHRGGLRIRRKHFNVSIAYLGRKGSDKRKKAIYACASHHQLQLFETPRERLSKAKSFSNSDGPQKGAHNIEVNSIERALEFKIKCTIEEVTLWETTMVRTQVIFSSSAAGIPT